MIRKTSTLFAAAFVIGVPVSHANAQSAASPIPPEILACANETDVMRRLSCFDREVASARSSIADPADSPAGQTATAATAQQVESSPAPPAEVPVPVPVVVAAKAIDVVPVADAVTENELPSSQAAGEIGDFGNDRALQNITATVTEIRAKPYGELIIRLDNGQVWEQKHVDRRFRLRIGETVTVSKGAVTGYRLSGNGNRSIQVERVK